MHTVRHVLIVARRFWPTITDGTMRLAYWAEHLSNLGTQVTVVSSRPNKDWPEQIQCGSVKVTRIELPNRRSVFQPGYLREMTNWIGRDLGRFDVIYCDDCGMEAKHLLQKLPAERRPPVIVRFDPDGQEGHANAAQNGNPPEPVSQGRKFRLQQPSKADSGGISSQVLDVCRRANGILVPSVGAHQRLLSAGIQKTPIGRILEPRLPTFDRSIGARRLARQTLSNTTQELFTRGTDHLLICPLDSGSHAGSEYLLNAVGPLLESQRKLRLWILGTGADCPVLRDQLIDRGLQRLVCLPGVFTDLELVLQAADLCIFPTIGSGFEWFIPTCAANNIPQLIVDSPRSRQLLGAELGIRIDSQHPSSLRSAIEGWLKEPANLQRHSLNLQRFAIVHSHPRSESHPLFDILASQLANGRQCR